jgi:predicted P-loop ATPase
MPLNITHDGTFDIATGRSRKETNWKNKNMQWSALVEKLSTTHRTAETYNEYVLSKKARQDEIKDVGAFVGGYLAGGRHKKDSILHRQLVTLDMDHGKKDLWDDFILMYGCAAAIYSTHHHKPEYPKCRLVIPLDREVTPDEFRAISRRIAENLDIDAFDHSTSYKPTQPMYWPSSSKDGEYFFDYQDGEWLKADEVLSTYSDWKDTSSWPISSREKDVRANEILKQGDPLEKPGVIGAFCRTYSIHEAIDAFLADVYEACDVENRYSYKEGSTAAGLVVYEDKYAFSHHGTDPTSGKLCNAFDLVRIHKFGLKDEDGTTLKGNRLPSYLAMVEFIQKDKRVSRQVGLEKFEKAKKDFGEVSDTIEEDENEDNSNWIDDLEMDAKNNYLSTRNNFKLVLENDPALKDCFAYDEFSKRKTVLRDLPWRKVTENSQWVQDEDECNLRIYMANEPYNMSHNGNLNDVFEALIMNHSVHPVKKYLQSLHWDGEERVSSVFIDYMGAADNLYSREVTKKALVACVARIFHPGVQFDYVLTLIGEEGKKKSSIFRKLAGRWFSDNFSFEMLKRGKEAFEQIQGYWIIEIPELSGLKKADIEPVKHFLTKRDDVFRIPHAKYTSQFKRQCVFFGTTNNWGFLQSNNGNRRFWPVPILAQTQKKDVEEDMTEDEVNQIWAEAVYLQSKKEKLYLSAEVENMAKEMQRAHTEMDERVGAIERYINTLVPENWNEMTLYERRGFLQADELTAIGTKLRSQICVAEIWCEVLNGNVKDMTSYNTKSLHNIMYNLEGWKAGNQRRFGFYGTQKAYLRENKKDKKEQVSSLSSLNL